LYEEYANIVGPFYDDLSILTNDREKLYFSSYLDIYEDYKSIMRVVVDLDQECVGLFLGSNDWEYPIWVLAGRHASPGLPRFEHVLVEDISGTLARDSGCSPQYVITTQKSGKEFILVPGYEIFESTRSVALLKNK
jgi:hypothetical protein